MNWVDKPQNYKDSYGILQLLRCSHLNNFPLKTLKLGWVAFHSLKFPLKCLDFQSYQYKKLAPVPSRFCSGLFNEQIWLSPGTSLNRGFTVERQYMEVLNSFVLHFYRGKLKVHATASNKECNILKA